MHPSPTQASEPLREKKRLRLDQRLELQPVIRLDWIYNFSLDLLFSYPHETIKVSIHETMSEISSRKRSPQSEREEAMRERINFASACTDQI